jgi:formylmethanofuran dehydrogenase subunit A
LLTSIDRELSLYELAIVTRAGQAKALGLKDKGHLGVGADADIAVYNINPELAAKKFVSARRAFERAAYTIKDGEIVVKDGEVVKQVFGRTYWVDVETSMPHEVNDDIKKKFRDYWTVEYENYPIREGFLHTPAPVAVKAVV